MSTRTVFMTTSVARRRPLDQDASTTVSRVAATRRDPGERATARRAKMAMCGRTGGPTMLTDAERTTLVHREELTPVSFLERAGDVHSTRVAVVDGGVSFDYRSWRARARRFADALRRAGMRKGDRVAFLA